MKNVIIMTAIFISFSSIGPAVSQNPNFPKMDLQVENHEFIFGEDKPFAQCHASTLESIGNGEYGVSWFAGSHEKNDDVGIWFSKGGPGNWSEPKMVAKIREDPHWNPVLFNAPDGRLHLYFKVGKEIDDWETWVQYSEDKGDTWSKPKELVEGNQGGRGPVRNHILVLSDGTWLAPASIEKNRVWNAFVDRSEDGGNTWMATDTLQLDRSAVVKEGVIQPALWESKEGHVHMLLRTSAGKIGRSDSFDFGKTWTPVELTDLPNNNSGIDVAHIKGDTVALAYNPVAKNWGPRYPMQIAVSLDNGRTWPVKEVVEQGSGKNEFSYPSLIYGKGSLVLCYTWNREKVAFWKARLE